MSLQIYAIQPKTIQLVYTLLCPEISNLFKLLPVVKVKSRVINHTSQVKVLFAKTFCSSNFQHITASLNGLHANV